MKAHNIITKIIPLTSLLLLVFIFHNCTNKEVWEENKVINTLNVYPQIVPFSNMGGDAELKVTAVEKEWEFSVPAGTSWVKAEKDGDFIKLKAGINEGEKQKIEITITTATSEKKVLIVQDAAVIEESIIINVPKFEKSRIFEVSVRGKKIGELCLEFLNKDNEEEVINEALVFYKSTIGTDVDYSNGYVINTAGTVTWDEDNYEYAAEDETELTHFYIMENGSYAIEGTSNQIESELQPKLLVDKRGSEINEYGITKVASNQWITKNLNTTKFVDGTDIPTGLDQPSWIALKSPGCAIYNSHDANDTDHPNYHLREMMGVLYNAYAISHPDLPPKGWRIATLDDWQGIVAYLGGTGVAGGHMKETGTEYWGKQSLGGETDTSINTGATNYSGISLRPAGYRYYTTHQLGKNYHSIGGYAYLLTNTIENEKISGFYCGYNTAAMGYMAEPLTEGCPVRLIKE